MVIQGSCEVSEVHNEAPEMPHHPNELLDGGIGIRLQEFNNSLHMFLTRLHPIFGDVVCEVCDLVMEQAAFRGFKLQVLCSKPIKYNPHTLQVLILILGEGDDIIEIDQAVGEI